MRTAFDHQQRLDRHTISNLPLNLGSADETIPILRPSRQHLRRVSRLTALGFGHGKRFTLLKSRGKNSSIGWRPWGCQSAEMERPCTSPSSMLVDN